MWCLAVSTAALLFSLRVAAAFRPDHGPRDFSKMDVDGDGLLSAAEIETHTDERLQAEIDGFMSFFDADGDYRVTKTEYDAEASKFFRTDEQTEAWFWKSLFPTNGESSDGTVDVEQLKKKKSLLLTATAQEMSRQWMAEHDENKDREVTRAEFGKGDPALWALLDPDGDGRTNARDYLKYGGQFAKPHLVINPHDVDLDGQLSASEFATMHHDL